MAATRLFCLTTITLCAIAVVATMSSLIGAQQGTKQHSSGGGDVSSKKKAQVHFDIGPFRVVLSYKENKMKDRLKLSKTVLNYYLATKQNSLHTHFFKHIYGEDLIRCDNFLARNPVMESLIECKPIEEQILDKGGAYDINPVPEKDFNPNSKPDRSHYVKRITHISKPKLDLLSSFFKSESESKPSQQHYQLYPFKAEYTEQTTKKILEEHGMEQGLGFGPHSITSGYFLTANLSHGLLCTANIFLSINLTKPMPAENQWGDEPEFMSKMNDFYNELENNGGFISVQDGTCGRGVFSLDFEFTFIYRRQFPYVTGSHKAVTKPITQIWEYNATIKQDRDHTDVQSKSLGAYNTTIHIKSTSYIWTNLIFDITHNITNKDYSMGSDQMFMVHPMVNAVLIGNWTRDSLVKSLVLFFEDGFEPQKFSIAKTNPKVMLMYENKPDNQFVTLSMQLERELFNNCKSSFEAFQDAHVVIPPSPPKPIDEKSSEVFTRNEL